MYLMAFSAVFSLLLLSMPNTISESYLSDRWWSLEDRVTGYQNPSLTRLSTDNAQWCGMPANGDECWTSFGCSII